MQSSLGQLSFELVELILEHVTDPHDLYQCTFISQLFYAAANPKLWQAPAETDSYGNRLETALPVLRCLVTARDPHLGHYIRTLAFNNDESASDILSLLAHTPQLKELEVQSDTLDDEDMERVARSCPRLERLCLEAVDISDQAAQAFGRHCCQLKYLTLGWCHGLTEECLIGFSSGGLERLEINAGQWIDSTRTVAYLDRFETLTHLCLSRCDKEHMMTFMQHLLSPPALTRLKGFGMDGYRDSRMDDGTMISFIQTHPLLEWLSLSNCEIDDRALEAMVEHLPGLKQVYLDHNHSITTRGVRSLINGCHRLVYVSLYGCRSCKQGFPEAGDDFTDTMELNRNEIDRIRLDHASLLID